MTGRKRTAAVINDHQLLTDLLKPALVERGFQHIEAFNDARYGVEFAVRHAPSLVILDMMLPLHRTYKGEKVGVFHPYILMDIRTALGAVKNIRERCAQTKVIILSGERHPHTFLKGFEAGAHGIASKLDDVSSFLRVLDQVLEGRGHVVSTRMKKLIDDYKKTPVPVLSSLEVQILELIQEGLESPQIGRRLGYAPKTIRNALSRINEKLGTSTRLEAVEVASDMGLVGWRTGDDVG